jgi:hypothetical protein
VTASKTDCAGILIGVSCYIHTTHRMGMLGEKKRKREYREKKVEENKEKD